MIFRPSSNLYTDQPLMTQECVKENKIGALRKDGKNLISVSSVYVDFYGNAGFCSDNPKAAKVHWILLYCSKDDYVLSFQFRYEPDFEEKLREMEFCAI